jgi:RNA polymerase sigma-70 factor (ECF subfamily)
LDDDFSFALRIDDQPGTEGCPRGPRVRPSFREVYEETFPLVLHAARRLGVQENELDDLVQEVFLAVHRRLGDFEGRSSVKTWVSSIVFRFVQNYWRTKRRKSDAHARSAEGIDPERLPDARADPSEFLIRVQARRTLRHLLGELSDEKALVFVLVEVEGLTVPEIARSMNANVDTIYSRLRMARRDFGSALARWHGLDADIEDEPTAPFGSPSRARGPGGESCISGFAGPR